VNYKRAYVNLGIK